MRRHRFRKKCACSEDYKREIEEWEQEQREREEESKYRQDDEPSQSGDDEFAKPDEAESDIDALIKKSLYGGEEEKETGEVDYSELTQRELQELIDDALDSGDFTKVKMLAQYMKEGKEIYLKEVERINEGHNFHTRRK